MGVRLGIGFLLIGLAVALDFFMRLRLRDLGEPDLFLRGGTLNYGIYPRQARQRGWSLLPVYFIFLLILAGVAFLAWALFVGAK